MTTYITPIIQVGSTIVPATQGQLVDPATYSTGTPSSSNFLRGDGSWSTPGGGGAESYINTSFSAVDSYNYNVDTSASTVTATLPITNTLNSVIKFSDAAGSFEQNKFTVNPNGGLIAGRSGNLTLGGNDASFALEYDGTKWNIIREPHKASLSYYNSVASTIPVSTTWFSVTYGNGVFVAVNNTNIAATSPDGITWTQRALPVSANWQSVTYGNGVFVAVAYGSAIAATSPDGITWTQRALPVSVNWYSVTYGNGVFVTVAYISAIASQTVII